MEFGLEFEFFVKRDEDGSIVPACEATYNLDGNPVVGEIKTGVHSTIVDAVFDLRKRIYVEQQALARKGYTMLIVPEVVLTTKALQEVRAHGQDRKEPIVEKSIYPNGGLSKLLKRNLFKASLQINMSSSRAQYFSVTVKGKTEGKYEKVTEVFDYVTPIQKLDQLFQKEISDTKRVKGVYAIKSGERGSRVEYRSLPNNISLDSLLNIL